MFAHLGFLGSCSSRHELGSAAPSGAPFSSRHRYPLKDEMLLTSLTLYWGRLYPNSTHTWISRPTMASCRLRLRTTPPKTSVKTLKRKQGFGYGGNSIRLTKATKRTTD